MKNLTYQSMLTGYKDRVQRIALFDIFSVLEAKQMKDQHQKPIDFFGLGLLSLLFFFENMLLRSRKKGIKELADFLYEMTEGQLFSSEKYFELAKEMIEVFRPKGGKRNIRSFYNYETSKTDQVEYAILKADDWDTERQVQYYALDEQGLELVFATKEYFSEFQISISQLMLRKQLEKGEFQSALRQVDEMRINVNSIRENIYQVKHEIQQSITSEETYARYKELIEDINKRLTREHDEFVELQQFIRETRGQLSQAENYHRDMELLVRIDNELAYVHYMHSDLLHESIELKNIALEAALESLYYAGITSFNFEQEITAKVAALPIPLMETKTLIAPLLSIEKMNTWSPLAVFAPQMREINNKDRNEQIFVRLQEDLESRIQRERQLHYRFYWRMIAEILRDKTLKEGKLRLSFATIRKEAKNLGMEELLDTREFAEMMVILHQMSPLRVNEVLDNEEHLFYDGFSEFFTPWQEVQLIERDKEIKGEHYDLVDFDLIFSQNVEEGSRQEETNDEGR